MERGGERRYCTFYRAPRTLWSVLRALLDPGVLQFVAHLEHLDDVHVRSFHYVPMTDELTVRFSCEGNELAIGMSWEGDLELTAGDDVPEDLFDRVCSHMRAYRRVGWRELARAQKRYAQIAKGGGETAGKHL